MKICVFVELRGGSIPRCVNSKSFTAAKTHRREEGTSLLHLQWFNVARVYSEYAHICWFAVESCASRAESLNKEPDLQLALVPFLRNFKSVNYCIWTFKQPIKGNVWVNIITCFAPYICQKELSSPIQIHDISIQRERERERNMQQLVLRETERWRVCVREKEAVTINRQN